MVVNNFSYSWIKKTPQKFWYNPYHRRFKQLKKLGTILANCSTNGVQLMFKYTGGRVKLHSVKLHTSILYPMSPL